MNRLNIIFQDQKYEAQNIKFVRNKWSAQNQLLNKIPFTVFVKNKHMNINNDLLK